MVSRSRPSSVSWGTPQLTLDNYSHLWPDSDDRTRDAIDAVLGAGVPPVPQGAARVIFTQVTGLGRTSWPVSRILCTGCLTASRPAVIHLGLPSPAGSSGLPAGIGRATLDRLRRPPPKGRPSWPCSGWGLPSHPGHPGCWWALTPPFHPYRPVWGRRSVFCGTVPRVTPGCR
jgi:hypothetical protein